MFVRLVILSGLSFGLLAACDTDSVSDANSASSSEQSRPTSATDKNTRQDDSKRGTDAGGAVENARAQHPETDASTALGEEDAGGSGRSAGHEAGAPNMVGDFALMLPMPEISIERGGMAGYDVVAMRAKGFTAPINIQISGLPKGASAVDSVISEVDDGTVVSFSVAPGATTGTTEFTVAGTSGPIAHSAQGSLIITGSSTTFTFTVTPYVLALPRGGSADATLTITPIDGFRGSVMLTLDYAPDGLTVDPASFEANGSEATVQKVTFTAAQTTAPGMIDVNLNIFSADTQGGGTIGIGVTIQ